MFKAIVLLAAAATLATGCKPGQPAQDDALPPPSQSPADVAHYNGPKVSVQVLQLESFPVQHVAAVGVDTPTGGWTLTRDNAVIENGTVKLYYTLERPGADEMVIQTFVTLRDRYVNTEQAFAHAEIHVHLAQRGVHTYTTNYVLATAQ